MVCGLTLAYRTLVLHWSEDEKCEQEKGMYEGNGVWTKQRNLREKS